uniref:restriction endonuclease subunit S n=1 Tax=Segatella hominis TaxID=2518605 RepID=UPI0040284380
MSSYYEKMLATGEVKCIDEEVPFEIPQGWEWCRMQDVITFVNGRAYKKEELLPQGKYKVLRVGNFFTNNEWYYSDLELPEDKYCYNGDLLYAWSASFGPQIWNGDKTIFHYHIWNIKFNSMILFREYLYYFFLFDKTQVKASTKGSTMVHVSMENMKPRLIPIPPVNEQKRIVHEIENIIPLIERYGIFQNNKEILDSNIKTTLKKSILQEAIQGKLVPQITEEGIAQELFEQIKTEKQKFVKEGKLKKSALNDSVIFRGDDNKYYEKIGKKIVCIEDEVPFEIPNSWVWVRLCAIVDFSKSQTISSSMLDMDSWILDLEDIEKDSGRLLQKKRMKELLSKSDKHLFYKGNVLYSKLRPYLNKVIVADEDGACTTEILAFDFGHIYNKYAQAYLMSPFFVDYANSDSYGIKMPRLGSKKGNNALFPIPPLREQQRIVEKIEQLMQLLK